MRKIILLAMLFIATIANCQVEKILGHWTTIDDKENVPVSIVNIYRGTDGKYYVTTIKFRKIIKHGVYNLDLRE